MRTTTNKQTNGEETVQDPNSSVVVKMSSEKKIKKFSEENKNRKPRPNGQHNNGTNSDKLCHVITRHQDDKSQNYTLRTSQPGKTTHFRTSQPKKKKYIHQDITTYGHYIFQDITT